ncbi:MAG: hypothetical protein KAJ29_03345 [Alphaproteobacteria bacterium]|nr:hypothetical protein [Alphaproteobacteria bacterium]
MKNFDQFHEALNRHSTDVKLTRAEAGEAFHNLTGFMSLLIQINERGKVVSFTGQESGAGHD